MLVTTYLRQLRERGYTELREVSDVGETGCPVRLGTGVSNDVYED